MLGKRCTQFTLQRFGHCILISKIDLNTLPFIMHIVSVPNGSLFEWWPLWNTQSSYTTAATPIACTLHNAASTKRKLQIVQQQLFVILKVRPSDHQTNSILLYRMILIISVGLRMVTSFIPNESGEITSVGGGYNE